MRNKYISVGEFASVSGFTTQYIYKVLNKMQKDDPDTYKGILQSTKGKKKLNAEALASYMGIDMPTEEKAVKTEIVASEDSKDILIQALNDRISDLLSRIESLEADKRNLEEDKKALQKMFDQLNERYNYEQQLQLARLSLPEEVEVVEDVPSAQEEDTSPDPIVKEPPKREGWFSRFRR